MEHTANLVVRGIIQDIERSNAFYLKALDKVKAGGPDAKTAIGGLSFEAWFRYQWSDKRENRWNLEGVPVSEDVRSAQKAAMDELDAVIKLYIPYLKDDNSAAAKTLKALAPA